MIEDLIRPGDLPQTIAVAVIEDHNRFVVGPRPARVHLGGFWEFPGGKVAPQETPAEAARREAWEETDLVVQVTDLLLWVECSDDERLLQLHFMACHLEAPGVPRHPFRWVSRSQLGRLAFPPANAEVVRRLQTRKFSRKR